MLKRQLKRGAIQGVLEACNLVSRAGLFRQSRRRGAIFTLHHVRPETPPAFAPNGHLTVTPDFLDAAIVTVKAMGYEIVHLHDLPRLLAKPPSDRAYCAFTLDDGYRNNAEHAYPVFRKHAAPFTIFVTGGFIDRTHSIWWETAEALARARDRFQFDFGQGPETVASATPGEKLIAFQRLHDFIRGPHEDAHITVLDAAARAHGVEPLEIVRDLVMDEAELKALTADPLAALGAHTISHPALAFTDAARLDREMSASADRVEAITGHRPQSFSYPYGDAAAAGPREYAAAKRNGFTVAVTTRPGMLSGQSGGEGHAMRLDRISLNGNFQRARYVRALASGLPFMARRGSV